MTIHFGAGVDCGDDEVLANAFVQAFHGLRIQISPLLSTVCSASAWIGEHGRRVVSVGVEGAMTGGPRENGEYVFLTDAALAAISGAVLEVLRTRPGFRVALVGWEVGEDIGFYEADWRFRRGVVVREDLPAPVTGGLALEPFMPGYRWTPPSGPDPWHYP